jgi:hypothetical protein
MGAVTRIPPAVKMPAGRISCPSVRLRLAGVVLAAASAFTSAHAGAGLVVLTPKPSPVVVDPLDSFTPGISSVNPDPSDPGLANSAWNSPSLAEAVVASDKPATIRDWRFVDPTLRARGVAPTSTSTAPLLIPLPTGISAGALGLVALGLILAPRRVRRMLLS